MKTAELIKNLEEKNHALQSELNLYQKRCEQYAQAYELMHRQLKELIRNRFGKKSERFIDPEHPQLSLVEDNSKIFQEAETLGESSHTDIKVSAHARKKKKKSDKELPVRIEIIPVLDENRKCSCGACKEVIRYETKRLIHHQPETKEIIEQRREVVACQKGCDGEMKTASAPLHVLPKAKATEEFLSFLIVSKLDDRQPLYHLEKQLYERHGIDYSRQTMARWLIDLTIPMQPIFNLFKDQVIDYDIASCDATTLQVLNEPERRAETKSHVYCIRGGSPDQSVILYAYNDREHKQFIKNWFEGFNGYLHVDGDVVFELIGKIIKLVNCNAHSRRKFEPIAQSTKGKGIAKEVLRIYRELYKVERESKNNNLTPDQRYGLRQQKLLCLDTVLWTKIF